MSQHTAHSTSVCTQYTGRTSVGTHYARGAKHTQHTAHGTYAGHIHHSSRHVATSMHERHTYTAHTRHTAHGTRTRHTAPRDTPCSHTHIHTPTRYKHAQGTRHTGSTHAIYNKPALFAPLVCAVCCMMCAQGGVRLRYHTPRSTQNDTQHPKQTRYTYTAHL